jgi:hypothetical protein
VELIIKNYQLRDEKGCRKPNGGAAYDELKILEQF